MWGSTTPNTADECTWANTPFNNGLGFYNEEYFTTHKSEWLDDNNNLKPEYDAASQIMGGDWRMPTQAEFQELLDNTTKESVTNFNGTGINGWKFISKTDTSKYIFIPAAGLRSNSSFHYRGSFGLVWSSSLNTSEPSNAWGLYFNSVNYYVSNDNRFNGWSVRGVRK